MAQFPPYSHPGPLFPDHWFWVLVREDQARRPSTSTVLGPSDSCFFLRLIRGVRISPSLRPFRTSTPCPRENPQTMAVGL